MSRFNLISAKATLLYAAVLIVLFLVGCESNAEERARIQRENDYADHQTCAGYGLAKGDPAYADCRLRLSQMRADRKAAALEAWRRNMQKQQQITKPIPIPQQSTTTCQDMGGGMISCRTY